jgi:hypothetical protein
MLFAWILSGRARSAAANSFFQGRIDSVFMAQQATSTRPDLAEGDGSAVDGLRTELARSQEEVLRLRDLLIAKESELGVLRGKLQEVESGAAPLITIALRLRTLLPGSLRSLLSRLLRRKPS